MGKLVDLKNNIRRLEVINKSESVSEVLLYGAIGESYWDENSISAKAFNEEIKKIPSSVKEIHLRVNSPGGSVFDGMSIYEKIRSEKSKGRKVTAYVDGIAASIASIIIQAADEIIIGDGGMVMIHKPSSYSYGNTIELERMITILDKIEEQMITIYAKKTGMSRVDIALALSEETWYTSDEAIELGLADKKFEAQETLQLVASMLDGCKWMKKKPESIKSQNDIVREKLRDFNSKAKEFLTRK